MLRRLLLLLFPLAFFALLLPADSLGQNPDDPNPPKQPTPEEMFRRQAEFSFKTRDRNGDGFLDKDEMPKELRDNLAKYDYDKDGRLSFDEYLEYRLLTRPMGRSTRVPQPSPKNRSSFRRNPLCRPLRRHASSSLTKMSWIGGRRSIEQASCPRVCPPGLN